MKEERKRELAHNIKNAIGVIKITAQLLKIETNNKLTERIEKQADMINAYLEELIKL